jgi:glycosyltransferase involved in cell wall biosynthesis
MTPCIPTWPAAPNIVCSNWLVSGVSFSYWEQDHRPDGQLAGCKYIGVGSPSPLYDQQGKRRIAEALIFSLRLFWPLMRAQEQVWDICSFPYFSVPVARLVSWLRGKQLVVTWHEFWGEYWGQYLGWRGIIGQLIERIALWCSPHIITGSLHTYRRLVAVGYPTRRLAYIPNGLDWQTIQNVARFAEGADLIYAGRLVPHKQVDLLLRTVAHLEKIGRHVTLDVIGDGPERNRLQQLAQQLGIEKRVRFLGKLSNASEVFARMKASKVLLLASQREGFGLIVPEAWACGIPVIVCREPYSAAVDLMDEEYKGQVVPSDPQALAQACCQLLDLGPDQHRQRRITAALAFDWTKIAEQLLDEYERLLRKNIR